MASRYDAFRYMPALIKDVLTHPIETAPDDINRMSEIVKATPFSTLTHYANMENDFGDIIEPAEPAFPEAKKKQIALFTVLFHVWGWQETIVFYLRYAGTEDKRIRSLQEENGSLQAEINTLKSAMRSESNTISTLQREREKDQETIKSQAEKILHLKAQLFDYMMKGDNEDAN